jgi:regulatory protein YycI of two-component signal transduction system YycFG
MDWSKAKNLMIIAFIITNIFLIYHIQKDRLNTDALTARSEQRTKEVVQILEGKGISVDAPIPIEVIELPSLEVEYIIYDTEKAKDLFFKKVKDQDDWLLTITSNDKTIIFNKINKFSALHELDEDTARSQAEKFLRDRGLINNNVAFWKQELINNIYKVYFHQRYKGRIVENSYMICTVTNAGVIGFERMWLNPLKFSSVKQEIIPVAKALLKFLEAREETEEVTLKNIELVYWIDLSNSSFTKWENIESGTAIPAWRIEDLKGNVTFIPAYED